MSKTGKKLIMAGYSSVLLAGMAIIQVNSFPIKSLSKPQLLTLILRPDTTP